MQSTTVRDGRKRNGGARVNAGRKKLPKTDQKIPITIFLRRGLVSAKGGQKALKQSLVSYAEN